jgi:antirestriction protein
MYKELLAYLPDLELTEEELEYFIADKHLNEDIVLAGLNCSIDLDLIADSYQGEYNSDEDFAEQYANGLGLLDKGLQWPYNCIDWTQAARELMYDYVEDNGYYFYSL